MRFKPIKVVEVELSQALPAFEGLERYAGLKVLVRLHGTPLGYLQLGLQQGRCSSSALRQAITQQHSWAILSHLVADGLTMDVPLADRPLVELLSIPHPSAQGRTPLVTVAVCTRDRASDLARCLAALQRLEYPAVELLVVDNAPHDQATAELVQREFPQVRYVCEPRPGLDWARNRAIVEARGEILAYTDDDVVVDSHWVSALVRVFEECPAAMAVTGMVAPYEIETEAQLLFEQYGGGFTPSMERREYQVATEAGERAGRDYGQVGQYGAGANMAYRRAVFAEIGSFDPALDVGTVTNGGGDLEMFFRVLKAGHMLVYEPSALVWHRHRRTYEELRRQITNDGIAYVSVLTRCAKAYPEERGDLLGVAMWWLRWWLIRRLILSFLRPSKHRRDLILAEIRGAVSGLTRYAQARRNAEQIAHSYKSLEQNLV